MQRASVALVTGAGSGIGAATVRRLRRRGIVVIVTDRDARRAASVAAEEDERYACAYPLTCDVTRIAELKTAVTTAISLGSLDVLVCSAGHPGQAARLENIPDADWDEIHQINAAGVANALRACAPEMRRQRSGAIVVISSIAGIVGSRGQLPYSAAKAAAIGLTKAAAKELRPDNIRVNAVAPGFIDTPMTQAMTEEIRKAWRIDRLAFGSRLGRADEVAAVVDFLCSDASSYVTGAVIPVDGGFTLGSP